MWTNLHITSSGSSQTQLLIKRKSNPKTAGWCKAHACALFHALNWIICIGGLLLFSTTQNHRNPPTYHTESQKHHVVSGKKQPTYFPVNTCSDYYLISTFKHSSLSWTGEKNRRTMSKNKTLCCSENLLFRKIAKYTHRPVYIIKIRDDVAHLLHVRWVQFIFCNISAPVSICCYIYLFLFITLIVRSRIVSKDVALIWIAANDILRCVPLHI